MLNVLDTANHKFQTGFPIPPDFISDIFDFLNEFVIKFHFGKEEGMMFEEMEEAGVFIEQLPIEFFKHEHDRLRNYLDKTDARLSKENISEQEKREILVEFIEKTVEILVSHSRNEDRVLYPMGDRLIPGERDKKLMEYYKSFDKKYPNYYKKYLDMVKKYENWIMRKTA